MRTRLTPPQPEAAAWSPAAATRTSPRAGQAAALAQSPRAVAQRLALERSFGPRAKVANPTPASRPAPLQRKHVLPEDRQAALDFLKGRYPNLTFSPHCRGSDEMDSFWEKYVGPEGAGGKSLAGVIETLLDRTLSEAESASKIWVTVLGLANGINLQVEVPGAFTVIQNLVAADGKLAIKIESVTAQKRGKALFAGGLLPLYRRLKVSKLELDASSIGGGDEGRYAWARYGFLPAPADWEQMRESGRAFINDRRSYFRRTDLDKQMLKILKDDSPRALRKLIVLSWERGDEAKAVLDRLLVSLKSWKGTLDLGHPDDLAWIEAYTGEQDKAAFAKLIPMFHQLANR